MIEAFLPMTGAIHAILINLTSVAWIYAFAYFAITHSDIFERSKKVADAFDSKDEKEAYKISDNYEELMEKRLKKAIENDKPYLNDQLTMPELADSIKVPAYLLSKYINKAYGKNFVTFINDLRIEVVKEKLKDQDMKNVSILEIAFQSGFRTKSAFNSYFKKSVGMTPSDFRRTSD
jgi:AraC-like DNA-binding protein